MPATLKGNRLIITPGPNGPGAVPAVLVYDPATPDKGTLHFGPIKAQPEPAPGPVQIRVPEKFSSAEAWEAAHAPEDGD